MLPGPAGRVPPFNPPVENMNFTGKLTDMLTAWRRLHLEVDSMTAVVGNTVRGKLKDYMNQSDTQVMIKTDVTLTDSDNRFENGKLTDKNGVVFDVISSGTANGKLTVTVRKRTSSPFKPALGNFTLLDDDALQDGQDVPDPDVSTVNAAMNYAYVRALRDIDSYNTTREAPFVLNMYGQTTGELEGMQRWDTANLNAQDFWVAYVLGGFQPAQNNDNDPNSEGAILGGTGKKGGSVIFLETNRDVAVEAKFELHAYEQDTVVHEIGHAVANSEAEPVTYWDLVDSSPTGNPNWIHPNASRYVDRYLHLIRSSLMPLKRQNE